MRSFLEIGSVIWMNCSVSFLFDAIFLENKGLSRHLKRMAISLFILSITIPIGIGIIFLPYLQNLGMVFEIEKSILTGFAFWIIISAVKVFLDDPIAGSLILRFFILLAITIGFIKYIV